MPRERRRRFGGNAANAAFKNLGDRTDLVHQEILDSQVVDAIEFYAAWTPLSSEYRECRARLMRLLAGRKNCRNFAQSNFAELNFPKSSLDGLRESVLTQEAKELVEAGAQDARIRIQRRLRLRNGEQLDAVGLTKRLWKLEYFPSVSRIAASPWLRGMAEAKSQPFEKLKGLCTKIDTCHLEAANWKQFEEFPYDGTIVYANRLKEFEKFGLGNDERGALNEIKELLKANRWEPQPYLGVLAADGDRMGAMISRIESAAGHREFSGDLAKFAARAKRIVEANHGCCVYAGGDDVLAFVPLDRILETARELHDEFAKVLERHNAPLAITERATLSVGVAIGHFLEPLEDLLEYARQAEKEAKGTERDGLAIRMHPRGGAPMGVRQSWKGKFFEVLTEFTDWHLKDLIPDKAAYDLLRLAQDYRDWPRQTEQERATLKAAFEPDAVRVLARKRGGGRAEHKAQLEGLEPRIREALQEGEGPEFVARCLAITRRIAEARRQTLGRKQ